MVWGVSSLGIQQDQLSHYPGSTLSNRKSGVATGSCTAAMVNKHLLNDCLVIKTAAVNFSLTICLSGMRVTIMVHTGCTVLVPEIQEINTYPLSENVENLGVSCVSNWGADTWLFSPGTKDTQKHMEDIVTTRLCSWGSLSQNCPMSSCIQLWQDDSLTARLLSPNSCPSVLTYWVTFL